MRAAIKNKVNQLTKLRMLTIDINSGKFRTDLFVLNINRVGRFRSHFFNAVSLNKLSSFVFPFKTKNNRFRKRPKLELWNSTHQEPKSVYETNRVIQKQPENNTLN